MTSTSKGSLTERGEKIIDSVLTLMQLDFSASVKDVIWDKFIDVCKTNRVSDAWIENWCLKKKIDRELTDFIVNRVPGCTPRLILQVHRSLREHHMPMTWLPVVPLGEVAKKEATPTVSFLEVVARKLKESPSFSEEQVEDIQRRVEAARAEAAMSLRAGPQGGCNCLNCRILD